MPDGGVPAPPAPGAETASFGIVRIGQDYVGIPLPSLSEVCQVAGLTRLLVGARLMSGGFDLRGQLIPVLDIAQACGLDDARELRPFAVVLRLADRLIAFLADQVMGITEVDTARVHVLNRSGTSAPADCANRVFLDADRLVSIIDVAALFDLPGVVCVEDLPIAQHRAVDDSRVSMLTFEVGGALFSVEVADVYGTVPRQAIEVGPMTSGYCLGAITYHTRRVPVIHTVDVLGLGRLEPRTTSEVVVLRCPDDRLLGLAVDAILDIQQVDTHAHAPVPDTISGRQSMLPRVIVRPDGTQVFVLSVERMLATPALAAVASLSTDPTTRTAAQLQAPAGSDPAPPRVGRYLVISVGRTFAVPLDQVTCILAPPDRLVPAFRAQKGLMGFFPRAPDSVPLVDLAAFLDVADIGSQTARVLLTGSAEHQVGFRVDRVLSIEPGVWTLDGYATAGPGSETLVQVGAGAARHVLPLIDLAQIAVRHFGVRATEHAPLRG